MGSLKIKIDWEEHVCSPFFREICLLTEYLDGGELFEKVISPEFTLTEKECGLFMRQICQAVAYLHSKVRMHPARVAIISLVQLATQ